GQHGNRGEDREKGMDEAALLTALNKSWTGFHNVFNDKYSSVTFNIPKKADGELKLSFTDVQVQHERARNNATFNYQENSFNTVEMYEDKKLNEKIMSSMLPVHRGSFFGPIYQFLVM